MTNVSTSAFYQNAIASMTDLRKQTEKLQAQIDTGSTIQHSRDNPLAAAQMRALQAADTLASADKANTSAAKTQLTQTDDTLSQFTDILSQITTLTTQAASSTLSDSQRASVGQQIGAYYDSLANLANTKDAQGNPLFGGQATGNAYTFDPTTGAPTYNGTTTASTLSLGPGLSVTTGVTGPEFLDFQSGGVSKNLLTTVKTLANTLQNPSSTAAAVSAAKNALDDLGAATASVSASQTVVGARLDWITTTTNMQTQTAAQRATREADVGGTDLAATIAKLSQQMTVLQAAQSSFVKVANLSLFSMLN
ncbi:MULTISPECIES: flagellar hook-associated protein FlgL [unclassified Novosphingobium]|uniref:flagellar hook-associated protein FlgL n=1 Tax=unclassified Novosphingobium TaxID=2644732 RepID=UPI000868F58E|nr:MULTISPECIES: flagellar hook-associated protein FlgL [unclassified Novosphingobium]MBN9143224.1 flagellar hook-associated protein FlgL [Novosphingobium sp.]MDR6706312.1 flagellar hook-associated protein 3 FlgL [Novosphingobium sp. 1748]ODU82683.1 MAG: flagellar hook-associated protein 3 [Novosphingobium sp. SCN 63-17]OJX89547.1 MAG: flagellar hook-associated protein 3 [Novosphingobium sp. 63-713]